MPHTDNFSRYFPPSKDFADCGCQVVSFGYEQVGKWGDYPLPGHPEDHYFCFSRGRILATYVIEVLTAGEGRFQAEGAEMVNVQAGDAFLLFPGIRHRYRRKAETGWNKWWIELSGPVTEDWMRIANFTPARPVLRQVASPVLLETFQELAVVTREDRPIQPLLTSAVALEIIARTRGAIERNDTEIDRTMGMVRTARQLIREQTANARIAWEDLAAKLGVSYSSLRQVFSRMVGLSPGQYHLFLRQRQAVSLLRNSDLSITEISDRLGFDTIYYFSRFIKQRTGLSPRELRSGEKVAFPLRERRVPQIPSTPEGNE